MDGRLFLYYSYQHKKIILHFDQVKVARINKEFENNVHLLIKPMIYKESSMEFELMIQPRNKNFVFIINTKISLVFQDKSKSIENVY